MDDTLPVVIAKRDDEERSLFDQPSFGYGDETKVLPVTRHTAFDEYGTRGAVPGTVGVAQEAFETPSADPITRIEKNLERAITKIVDLQRRIESIETILSRIDR